MKTTKTKSARKGFVLNRNCTVRGYADLRLSFVRANRWDAERPEFAKLMLRWQANDGTHYASGADDKSDWYGLHAEMDCDRLETFVEESKLAGKINSLMVGFGESPADFVAQLESLGWVRYVQDARVSPDLVPFSDALPADFKRYVPNYRTLCWDSCRVSCVARDETTAKSMLLQELASRGSNFGDESVKLCKAYLDAGMPVMLASYSDAPALVSTADLLASPKAQQAKQVAASQAA